MNPDPNYQYRDNPEARRFEVMRDGVVVGFADYRPAGDARMFSHTEVDSTLEGQGVGSALVRFALEQTRDQGMQVVPMCPFVAAFMQRHREFTALVNPAQRGIFGL